MEGYLSLKHGENYNENPIILGNTISLSHPEDYDDEEIIYLDIPDIPNVNKIWVGVLFDYAYGKDVFLATTRNECVATALKYLEECYPLNNDYEVPGIRAIDKYLNYTKKTLELSNWVSLPNHPFEPDEDLTPPVLVIKEAMIKT